MSEARSDLLIGGLYFIFKNSLVIRDADGRHLPASREKEKEGDDQKLDSLLRMGKVVAYLILSCSI